MVTEDYRTKETEAKYKTIKEEFDKINIRIIISRICSIIFIATFISTILLSIILPKDDEGELIDPNANTLVKSILPLLFLVSGMIAIFILPRKIKILGNAHYETFYYVFSAYENRHSEKARTLLTSAIRNIEEIIEEYKELPFSGEVVHKLNILRDILSYHTFRTPS